MPRLSVLMPARDAEATIGIAVRSTLAAMPRDAELVVLDDGSTAGTLERLRSVRDRRLVIRHEDTAHGVAGGLQLLLDSTDSRLVARMDADDIVLPGRFRAQLRAIEQGPRVVFAGVIRFGRALNRLRPWSPLKLEDAALRLGLLAVNPFGHPTLLADRAALEQVGGYRDVIAEDYELWLRIAAARIPMLRMRRPVLGYRVYDGQTSGSPVWAERALTEPGMLRSYDELAEQLLGMTSEEEGFLRALRARAESLPRLQRAWVLRRIENSPSLPVLLDRHDIGRARRAADCSAPQA